MLRKLNVNFVSAQCYLPQNKTDEDTEVLTNSTDESTWHLWEICGNSCTDSPYVRISWNQCKDSRRAKNNYAFTRYNRCAALEISKNNVVHSISSKRTTCMKSACSSTSCPKHIGGQAMIAIGVSAFLLFAVVVVSLMKIRNSTSVHIDVENEPEPG